jgi:hypothetical protein
MLRVMTVNKAATTLSDVDNTTLWFVLFLCCGLSLRAESQTPHAGVLQSQRDCFGCLSATAGVHLAWGMDPQTRETSKLCKDE